MEEQNEYYIGSINANNPIWLDGITVTPLGNRSTTYDNWYKTNELERASEKHAKRVARHYPNFRKFTGKAANLGLQLLGKMGQLFNGLVTAGAETDFGQTSPFSDIDRKAVLQSRRRVAKKTREKIEEYSPFISPSSYIAAIVNDEIDPRIGAYILSEQSPELLLSSALFDIWALGRNTKVPGDIRAGLDNIKYAGKKLYGYATEDFRFPENGRIPYRGSELAAELDWNANHSPYRIKRFKYKYGYDRWDKLMLDDMIAKLKKQTDKGNIKPSMYDYSRKSIEKLKDDTYHVVDYADERTLDGYSELGGNYVSSLSDPYTGTHEGIMHSTDPYVDIYDWYDDFWAPYEVFVDKLSLPETLTKDWFEARATIGELKKRILKQVGKEHPEAAYDIEVLRPYYEEFVNKVPDKRLRHMLKRSNDYGASYVKYERNNPTFIQDLRDLLINGF